ncbi:MAG: penicillin acylase family protein [Gammaproteobacteria bacterium]|nr:penicillin acylase family protein [Gammaproteobacteria bacterium]
MRRFLASPRGRGWVPTRVSLASLVAVAVVAGCSDSSNPPKSPAVVEPPPVSKPADIIFAPATGPVATIRRTTSGVPHVKADDLQSAAFGLGYAQAQDNLCLLADSFLKARGERAKYLGPGPGNIHIINDFSYRAQHIRSGALEDLSVMGNESRALIYGFTAGYNKYLKETSPANYPAECRNQPWVFPIEAEDLVAYLRIVAQYASGANFVTGVMYLAVPPGVSPNPVPVAVAAADLERSMGLGEATTRFARNFASQRHDFTDIGLASNAWGVGGTLTETGKGALLANPHFPYTGSRRFYESQVTVPNYINFHGAGLVGSPIPQIGFNQNLGWSHTVSASRRFTLYELKLKAGDNLTYVKDGKEKPITQEVITIQVANGTPTPTKLQRTFYYSEYGPMIAANAINSALPAWGAVGTAYTYRDANANTNDLLATWLKMARATTLDELKAVFQNCGSTLWVNTTYADDKGNAFYTDSSSVPNLSAEAIAVLNQKRAASPAYAALFNAGLTLLDGSTSRDDWIEGTCHGLVPFAQRPQLVRTDFVQNSNDSHWATNPKAPLEGYSPLYGPERSALNPRTRIGINMLQNPAAKGYAAEAPAGQDGKFSAQDLIRTIYNDRSWYSEEFLTELRARCDLIGAGEVSLGGGATRKVDAGCAVLKTWSGNYDASSIGAHVFRVFIADYRNKFGTDLTKPFDPANPVFTPSTPKPADPANLANDPMLTSLAAGLQRLDQAGIAYNARFGTVQVFQASGGVPPGGTAVSLGASFPWHGGDGTIDGTFNAVRTVDSTVAEDTRIPRYNPATIANTVGLSTKPGEGWLVAYGTSWHFGLEFTATGPRAYGLLSYSESSDGSSPYFNDQQRRYADEDPRPILFSEADIAANVLPGGTVTIKGN